LSAAGHVPVVVTEKDAEKIKALGGAWRERCWYVEIEMRFAGSVDERLERLFESCGLRLRAGREERESAT
jgi:tetraacyldisaccharide-1-P 4'-kinase